MEKLPRRARKKTESIDSLIDEHCCLAAILESIKKVHRKGGIPFEIGEERRMGKVWIHVIIGDTAGNNRWLAHYNSSGSMHRPYRDCRCGYLAMSHSNPQCVYITLNEVEDAKRRQESGDTKSKKKAVSREMSMHLIENAFSHEDVPIYDDVSGIYGITPPELLHTTQEGLTKYIIEALGLLLNKGDSKRAKKAREVIDNLHHTFHKARGGNSDRDFPISADRTSLFTNTLIQAAERRGNIFVLLCVSHCQLADDYFVDALKQVGVCLFSL